MLDFRCQDLAKCTAYHEAGHAVAGVGLGCVPAAAYIYPDTSGLVEWSRQTEGQSIAQVRRTLIQVVAGPVAEFLYEGHDLERTAERMRWWDRKDPCEWEASYRLLSARIALGETGGQGCDTAQAIDNAREVCRRLKLQDNGQWDEKRIRTDFFHQNGRGGLYRHSTFPSVVPPVVTEAEILAEVIRAERWAERLLNRRWSAVVAVAEALFESETGVLTGEEVTALVCSN